MASIASAVSKAANTPAVAHLRGEIARRDEKLREEAAARARLERLAAETEVGCGIDGCRTDGRSQRKFRSATLFSVSKHPYHSI